MKEQKDEKIHTYDTLYQSLLLEQEQFHRKNQLRIRNGIKCIICIPLLFLALVFLTDSTKVIFLTLWIISMFLLSAYLIYVEYVDFKVQQLISNVTQDDSLTHQALIGNNLDSFEQSVLEILQEWEKSLPSRKKIEELLAARKILQKGERS